MYPPSGGAPAEGVRLKAGTADHEPKVVINDRGGVTITLPP